MTPYKKITLIVSAILSISCLIWVAINPRSGFGMSSYAFTTFNRIPLPLTDFQVRSNGSFCIVKKTHDLSLTDIEWLLHDKPEVVIICTGWSGVLVSRSDVTKLPGHQLHILKTGEAIGLYNRLKKEGKRVAIHVHSTC